MRKVKARLLSAPQPAKGYICRALVVLIVKTLLV